MFTTGDEQEGDDVRTDIEELINHYRRIWENGLDHGPDPSGRFGDAGFFLRRRIPHGPGRCDGQSENGCSTEMYRSALHCLAYLRWCIIPERLREASGLADEIDLEALLDGSGYSVSLIAEVLFEMLDECLESSSCTPEDLRRIRLAYNGLSYFKDAMADRITAWGYLSGQDVRSESTAATMALSSPLRRFTHHRKPASGALAV
jgi:hypothetical protein